MEKTSDLVKTEQEQRFPIKWHLLGDDVVDGDGDDGFGGSDDKDDNEQEEEDGFSFGAVGVKQPILLLFASRWDYSGGAAKIHQSIL